MSEILETTTADDDTEFRVSLVLDSDPAVNPRDDYSNAGVIYVIDQRHYDVPQESDVPGLDAAIIDHDFRVVARWLRIFHGATVVLPLYSTGGRDFAIGAGTPDEAPESGDYVGVTFDTAQTRRDTIGESLIPAEDETPTMTRALTADIETYAQWAEGDVWGWVIETGPGADDVELDIDSCWGFIGRQWAEEAAREALADAVHSHSVRLAEDWAEDDDLRRAELPEAVPAP